MYTALYEYLILHHHLSMPGIGTFQLRREPAELDFPGKRIEPGWYSVSLHFPAGAPSTGFFSWLAGALNISDREAVIRFNDFAFDLKKNISSGSRIRWQGVGTLSKGLAGEVRFAPQQRIQTGEQAVAAEKVLREKAEHQVRVGEDERSAAEMTEYFAETRPQRSSWWLPALVTGIAALVFLGWYFSEHGMDMHAAGLQQSLVPQNSPAATYQPIP